jgi:Kef-type K+ transport system membrane component KefB
MPKRKLVFSYAVLVGLPVLILLGVLDAGRNLTVPSAARAMPALRAAASLTPTAAHAVSRLTLQILVVLLVSRAVSWVFKKANQPQVVGEMAAGVALGPSLLGWLAPGISAALFPPASLDYLYAFSQLGLVLFIFLVGLSLNSSELREHSHAAILTSHVSIAVPFCLGGAMALVLYPKLSNSGVSFNGFALFMGAAMSITAFPVLARILAERNLLRTRMGCLTIACAAVDDVTGWCVLAYIVVAIRSSQSSAPVWAQAAGVIVYVLIMLLGVRPILPRFEKSFRSRGRLTDTAVAALLMAIMASALCTEWLGIHQLFGAFLLGAVMPKDSAFVDHIKQLFESVTVVLLLPLFFAYTGLRTSIGTLAGPGMWTYTLMVLGGAVAGKAGGCLAAGRLAGMSWRDASALGILMNTRGLMELVILNIGLDIGVISPPVFSMMVTMALVTTLMTTPLLDKVYRPPQLQAELAAGRVA